MEMKLGKLYRVSPNAGHIHYRQLRGQLVTYTGSPTENLASVQHKGRGWVVYKRDLTLYEPDNNMEATYLLLKEEEYT
jgi:hypothetical protein